MCVVRRWARSSTRAERGLLLLAGALLAALPALLVLGALHLAACRAPTPAPPLHSNTSVDHTARVTLAPPGLGSRSSTRCTAGPLHGGPDNSTEYPDSLFTESPDGEPVDDREYEFVLALVKVRPAGVTFGCVLSALTARWAATAASCIDAVEEVDSLDSFVMMERSGRATAVGGVRVHPRYAAGAGSIDLALVLAAGRLRARPARLATALALRRAAIGERLELLGFGTFRSVEAGGARRLRAAGVVRLPAAACAGAGGEGAAGGGGGEPRHLRPAPPAAAARCAAPPLCTGVLFARDQPCQFCAGAALVWRGALAGVRGARGAGGGGGGAGDCGAGCEPAPAAALAAHGAWLRAARDDHDDLL